MYTCKIFDEAGNEVACEEVDGFGAVTVVMIGHGKDGKVVVDSYEPGEINRHPHTEGEIGHRIVQFFEKL